MDKNAIKKYAVWARNELISRVRQKALQYGISEKDCDDKEADVVNGHLLSAPEKKQRQALISKISRDGYHQVMEEAAYTWFNRFSALRYMEVNGLLPSRVRVFTDDQNNFRPQILAEAINMSLDGLDMKRVCALKEASKSEELYKYLLITQCNALSSILPGLFQKIEDYTELLFPDNILRVESVIGQMIALIPQEDWTDQVQIIGWLYQYYNTEPKNAVFAGLKNNIKISKEDIPAATQLFTPDWIVRYMVENSLGRLWTEGHPNNDLKKGWKYFLEEAQQEPEVEAQLEAIRGEYAKLTPEDIRVIDPCMGSGHILVVMFDVLMQIYLSYGYTPGDAVSCIVEKNLWGLDIDDRAAQLAYFAVMMKARQYDGGFFRRKVQPNVYVIEESNGINREGEEYKLFVNGDAGLKKALDTIMDELCDAREYGSILNVSLTACEALEKRVAEVEGDSSLAHAGVQKHILPLIKVARAMAQKYDVVCTNPPYMGSSNMNTTLSKFIKKKYADYKSDFFSAFVVRASEMTKPEGYCGFFTPYVWMFIQSYEELRQFLYSQTTLETLIQFEYSAFEEATVPVCTFAFKNSHVDGKKGAYLRLVDFRGGMEVQRQKTLEAIVDHNCGYYYEQTTDNFSKIPGAPVAYWV
ncbi:MAG: BREX-1 system adenine-specific DNA-methyltransferase PglX, partial [Desulfovibrionaceae bacterium]|nr:BREX-1 system adenine-specific DNA-methyltransferase PglX [Desulfovibrionaceae bacterium]